jgi:NAD+ diphosphatase
MNILNLRLARSTVDRAAHLRSDENALAAAWQNAKIIHFNGSQFLADGNSLAFLTSDEISEAISASENRSDSLRIFLGEADGQNFFLWMSEENNGAEESYKTLREISAELSPLEIGLAVHAQALAFWHQKSQFCPQCGSRTTPALGGSVRRCEEGHELYPRTDPAIIVLVKDASDRILLGRQGVWPEHRFSTFAGFVEAGESFEQCVVREVFEEAGVKVSNINYLGSQPWPFPQSLMIAFEATIDDPENARPDGEEIVEIRWFDRNELYAAIVEGSLLLPPVISVARAMIQAWYGEKPLPGAETWR